jgi:hypothetical protein
MPSLVTTIHDAAVSPEVWPEALKALTDAADAAGAALIVLNKDTGNVDEACFFGLGAGFRSAYVRHYAALDPYSPLLDGGCFFPKERFRATLGVILYATAGVAGCLSTPKAPCSSSWHCRFFTESPARV